MGPIIFFFEGALQLLFGPSSEGIVSYVAVDLLCPWEDVNSGFFCAAICVSEQREWEESGTSWTSLPGKNSYGVRGLNHSFLSLKTLDQVFTAFGRWFSVLVVCYNFNSTLLCLMLSYRPLKLYSLVKNTFSFCGCLDAVWGS